MRLRLFLCLLLVCYEIISPQSSHNYTLASLGASSLEREDGLIYRSSAPLRHRRDVVRKERLAFDGTIGTATVSVLQVEGGGVWDAVVVEKDRIFAVTKDAEHGPTDQLTLAQLQKDLVRIVYRKCPEPWRLDLQNKTNEKLSTCREFL